MKILATSDLHGNITQYKKLLNFIINNKDIEAIFIDGDISVRRSILRDAIIKNIEEKENRIVTPEEKTEIESTKVVDKQYEWFTDIFFPLMKQSSVPIYMNMGNADYKINLNRLRKFFENKKEEIDIILLENNKLIPLKGKNNKEKEELYLYSLSNVSLSSHRNKDWESIDMKNDIEDIKEYFNSHPDSPKKEAHYIVINGIEKRILLSGLKSKNIEGKMILVNEQVSLSQEDTLEEMLENFEKSVSPDVFSKTICLMHAPPYGTPLDIVKGGEHAGSIAFKNFINKNKPLISIHGHIHESVNMSNVFMVDNNINSSKKQSISVSIGNDFKSKVFSFVIFDTKNVLNVQRYQI
ncbi:hypothetical protein BCR36DRAFT_413680 [Piromyces finnis]|uniref:Calcineurin-like phosphoesterase domain-containing protein n=1 Tax=Piromyces finnis TaxID=1754191 RepID=A0A1Y1V503_9FUNG|nr:hypothetical protein BCR36DRAFT_413680 [Piromyces finnis]|eukprot:ORX47329.1 hypothetical protein BCR36DRAFT_413680 [Piromyces finnis]